MKRLLPCYLLGYLLAVLVLTSTNLVFAQSTADTPANREKAAQRYLQAVPVQSMVDSMTTEMAKQMPADQRAKFTETLTHKVRWNVIMDAQKSALVKMFTLAEINKMAEFYGSPEGKSIMKKFGPFMASVMPTIQQEMMRAMNLSQQP